MGYTLHPSDEGSLQDAQELHITDFAKIATGIDNYKIPPTLCRSAMATILVDSAPSDMLRAVLTNILTMRTLTDGTQETSTNGDSVGLSCAAFDYLCTLDPPLEAGSVEIIPEVAVEQDFDSVAAPMLTRKGRQRMLELEAPPQPESPGVHKK